MGHNVRRVAEYEFGEFPGDDVLIPKLTRARIRVRHLGNGKDRHWAAEPSTPFVHIVQRAGGGAEGMKLDTEALRDELDVLPLIYGWQIRKDRGQRAQCAAEPATMVRRRVCRDRGRVEATAQEDDVLARKTPSHSLLE